MFVKYYNIENEQNAFANLENKEVEATFVAETAIKTTRNILIATPRYPHRMKFFVMLNLFLQCPASENVL